MTLREAIMHRMIMKYVDFDKAEQCIQESRLYVEDFADYVCSYAEDNQTAITEIDIVALAYQFIAEKAEAAELNNYLYFSFSATHFDIIPAKAQKILEKVSPQRRNAAWHWLKAQF